MKYEVGSTAPSFEALDAEDGTWKIPEDLEDKYLVLVFLRHLGCPLCMKRLDDLNSDAMRFEAFGAMVMVVVEGTANRVRSFAAKKRMKIRIVGDKEKKLYGTWGVERGGLKAFMAPNVLKETAKATLKGYMHGRFEGDELQKPADFIISPGGKIVWAHYGVDISDSSESTKLIEELSKIVKDNK